MTEHEEIGRWSALRLCLVALVFLNLVFVQVSGGVGVHWMVPMFALTLASPLLSRFQKSSVYRMLWNVGVLAIFTLLVRDAGRTGIRFLLEDGLILAAFSQVHLLNNLGGRQKPDLLFFNSFLIALVTSFFCQDMVFAGIFAIYAFTLTVGLQLSCASSHGWSSQLVKDGGRKAAIALGMTLVVFLVCPRDFHREGLVGETLRHTAMDVGFTENVELGRSGKTVVSNRVVMRARLLSGTRNDVPTHWRGATFIYFENGRWLPDDRPQHHSLLSMDAPWLHPRAGRWMRGDSDERARLDVQVTDWTSRRLFAPLTSTKLDLAEAWQGSFLRLLADGTVQYVQSTAPEDAESIRYELGVGDSGPEGNPAEVFRMSTTVLPHLRALHGLPDNGRAIANRIALDHRDAPQHEIVEAMRRHLAETYSYMLPGTQGAARDLQDFMAGSSGGHCEYFATALALMLRSQNIPCRLVTGYLCDEWDETDTVLTVRSKHAHAWVEVYDPILGWSTVDPSPAEAGEQDAEVSWFAAVTTSIEKLWNEVASFDGDARTAAIAWLRDLPGRCVAWVRRNPIEGIGIAGLLIALVTWRRRWRRRGENLDVRSYTEVLRRAGIERRDGETPRELLGRAKTAGAFESDVLHQLEVATVAHETARYASCQGAVTGSRL